MPGPRNGSPNMSKRRKFEHQAETISTSRAPRQAAAAANRMFSTSYDEDTGVQHVSTDEYQSLRPLSTTFPHETEHMNHITISLSSLSFEVYRSHRDAIKEQLLLVPDMKVPYDFWTALDNTLIESDWLQFSSTAPSKAIITTKTGWPDIESAIILYKTFQTIAEWADVRNLTNIADSATYSQTTYCLMLSCHRPFAAKLEAAPQMRVSLVKLLEKLQRVHRESQLSTLASARLEEESWERTLLLDADDDTLHAWRAVKDTKWDISGDGNILTWEQWVGPSIVRTKFESGMLSVTAASIIGKAHRGLKNILLYGPPGTGKTSVALTAAKEAKYASYAVRPENVPHSKVGQSEKFFSLLFRDAIHHQPSMIFIDEIDGVLCPGTGTRQDHVDRRLKSFQVNLKELDRSRELVMVVGATNRAWKIDNEPGLLNRFQETVHLPLLDSESRKAMIYLYLKAEYTTIKLTTAGRQFDALE